MNAKGGLCRVRDTYNACGSISEPRICLERFTWKDDVPYHVWSAEGQPFLFMLEHDKSN